LIFGIFLIGIINANAQTNKLLFSYDTAGNQIARTLCVNCPANLGRPGKPKEVQKTPEIETVVIDKVTFFPNPVAEELNIKWELIDNKTVENITVYNLNGALMQSYSDLKNDTLKVLPFGIYPSGMYIVSLTYSNGEQKSLQIIKK
jgi:Secretion system C-terminal sorting domain